MRPEYDLAVIGSGAAAFAAAIAASDLGKRVVLAESNQVGGTCVNVGCIPSKALLATASRGIELSTIVDAKNRLVDQMRTEKYIDLARAYGFEILRGHAEFVNGESVTVGGEPISAHAYLIASGASPAVPAIDGLQEAGYLTSTSALAVRTPPRELAVIGANAVGLELGQLFMKLGSKVTFLEAMPRITPLEELEVSAVMRSILEEDGATVLTGVKIESVRRYGDRRRVSFERRGERNELSVDEVLVATGRRPNTSEMGLDKAGIELTERGAISVNERLGTSNPRVWAAGDVTGHPQFVYVAAYEGNLAARNALEGADLKVDLAAMPRIIFTTPTVAAAGLTDGQANAQGIRCACRVLPLSAVPRALVNRDTRGFVKIVAERSSGRILGATAVADGAGDVIQAAVYAIRFGLTTDQVAATWSPYLTFAEGFKLAAQTFKRDVSKLSCCAA